MRIALQISEQFSPKARTPAHWMTRSDQILTQNGHSRSFTVIYFGIIEELLRGYIAQYNIVALNVNVRKSRHSDWNKRKSPFTTTPLSFDAPSLTNPWEYPHKSYPVETRIPGLHFYRWHYIGSSSNFRTVLSESQKRQLIRCRVRNRFLTQNGHLRSYILVSLKSHYGTT